jgi:hypothetical protein
VSKSSKSVTGTMKTVDVNFAPFVRGSAKVALVGNSRLPMVQALSRAESRTNGVFLLNLQA